MQHRAGVFRNTLVLIRLCESPVMIVISVSPRRLDLEEATSVCLRYEKRYNVAQTVTSSIEVVGGNERVASHFVTCPKCMSQSQ